MRKRTSTKGKVTGVKFALNGEKEEDDLKMVKANLLKELEEKEKNTDEWYDKEMEKNLKK
jgi:hypothetical protein